MPISNFHKVIRLSSLGVLITGTSFSYVATPSEGNFSLLGPHLAMSWYILFEKKLVGGDVYSGPKSSYLAKRAISGVFFSFDLYLG